MKDITVSELPPCFLFPLHSALESAARSHLLIFRRVASSPSFPSVLLLPLAWVIFSVWWQWHHFLVPSWEWSHWTPLTLRTSPNSPEGHTGPSPCGSRTCPSCRIRLHGLSERLELFLSWLLLLLGMTSLSFYLEDSVLGLSAPSPDGSLMWRGFSRLLKAGDVPCHVVCSLFVWLLWGRNKLSSTL